MRKTVMTLLILGFVAVAFILAGRMQAGGTEIQVATRGAEPSDPQGIWGTLDGRFVAGKNGTVIDSETGLEWFVGPDEDTNWDEANNWVKSLSVDGGSWRMPKRDELKALYAEVEGKQDIIPAFRTKISPLFQTTGWFVWSSETMSLKDRVYAWGFSFNMGCEYGPPCTRSNISRAFAVRPAMIISTAAK